MLDEEIEESEKRLKAAARSKLGASSLLAQATKASGGARRSMMGAGSTGSGNMVGGSSRRTAANTGVTVKRYAK
jgi:hypothetical protein